MDIWVIQLTNQKAYKIIQDLEELHLVRVLQKNFKSEVALSEKFAGRLPVDIADDIQKHVCKSRTEWSDI
jgi:hypothetical protein